MLGNKTFNLSRLDDYTAATKGLKFDLKYLACATYVIACHGFQMHSLRNSMLFKITTRTVRNFVSICISTF